MSDTHPKPQKLASAVYLITSFFSDQEPLKWRLRNLSADLVSDKVKDKFGTSEEILTLFTLAKTAGLVAEANYELLVREFSKFQGEAKKPLELMFSREEVFEEALGAPQELPKLLRDNTYTPSVKAAESAAEKPAQFPEPKRLKEFGAVSVKKNSRQSIIIGLLKRKKEIMIKDVSPLISGCSEKTIQRELSEMVAAGVLKRTGEKRWSRYSLA